MRILATVSDQCWGGKHRYMTDVLCGLADLGHEVTLIAETGSRMAQHGTGTALAVVPAPPFETAPGPADAAVAAVAAVVRQASPDVLIASGRRDLMVVSRVRHALNSSQPFLFFRHSAFPLSEQESSPDILTGITQIICTSRSQITAQFAAATAAGWISPDQVTLIPSGVSGDLAERVAACDAAAARRQLRIDPDRFVYLVLARLSWEKGIAGVIQAFAAMRSQETALVIAGEGPELAALEEAAVHAGLAEQVLFTGHVDDVTMLLSAADTVVLGSTVPETGPLALKEAMAAGKAVIAPATGGIPEFIDDGRNGLLYETGNVESLADAMRQVLEQEDYCGALGRAGAQTIRAGHRLASRVEYLSWLLDLLLLRSLPGTALREQCWDSVRIRTEQPFVFLFVSRTSQLTELPFDAAEVIQRSVTAQNPAMLMALPEAGRAEMIERLYRMGALRRAAAPNGQRAA